ncbi:hypothetical protein LEP1GSC123_2419 [Leptospira borgpetersenii str. 200701203]|uniref:Dolichyl-phosphate-mannose-protein mannosyltransferase n=1 Tax=Leptospira borgpetersenii str. 200701203 TaxID=1193007 RepID=M3GH69_LEPBO|nr:hypothetical protein LEP1GSC123_2419 [Leptospira borgpetersenii str. 200701203]
MDVGVGLFLFVSGIVLYQRSKKNRSFLSAALGGMVLSLSYWFRLEYLIFIGLYWICESFLRLPFSKENEYHKRFFLTSTVLIILFFGYCGFNQSFFHSPLGPRYNANYSHSGFSNLFKNFINLLFYGNLKLGVFGYSPFLFVGLLFFLSTQVRNWKNIPEKEKPLLISSILGILTAAIVAPNDGGAESGSRYLTPGLPGLFVLTSGFFRFYEPKKSFGEFHSTFFLRPQFFRLGYTTKRQRALQKTQKKFKSSFSKNPKKIF